MRHAEVAFGQRPVQLLPAEMSIHVAAPGLDDLLGGLEALGAKPSEQAAGDDVEVRVISSGRAAAALISRACGRRTGPSARLADAGPSACWCIAAGVSAVRALLGSPLGLEPTKTTNYPSATLPRSWSP